MAKQTQCDNFKAIYLPLIGFKVYIWLLEKTLRKGIEGKLKDEQAAFNIAKQTNDKSNKKCDQKSNR